jgi:hypothetical protein
VGNYASNGSDKTEDVLKMFENKMTESQKEESQRRAIECVKNNYKGC